MMQGKVKSATCLLTKENRSGRVLPLSHEIAGKSLFWRSTHQLDHWTVKFSLSSLVEAYPAMFHEIDGLTILKSALNTEGSAGPSGMDARLWRRMCCLFQNASSALCEALASTARRISSSFVGPEPLQPLIACRLIAMDKCPGVRPVGIREVVRRILIKAILSVVRYDIQEAVGSHQLCVGRKSECEAAIHVLEELFHEDTTEGILLIDASNAFNNLNC